MQINKTSAPAIKLPSISSLPFGTVFSKGGDEYIRVDGGVLRLTGPDSYRVTEMTSKTRWFESRPDVVWIAVLELRD